jgi:hypothetical protein
MILTLALATYMLALGAGGMDSLSADSARVIRYQAWKKVHSELVIGVDSDYDLLLVDPQGKSLRFGKGVDEGLWRHEFRADHARPGSVTQIHIPEPSAGQWKLRVAIERDVKALTVQTFASCGGSADDCLAPAKRDYAQWWKISFSRDAKRDTCWMRLVRWKREKIRR